MIKCWEHIFEWGGNEDFLRAIENTPTLRRSRRSYSACKRCRLNLGLAFQGPAAGRGPTLGGSPDGVPLPLASVFSRVSQPSGLEPTR